MRIKADGIQFPKHFIRAGEAFNTFEAHVPAPYFRKTFTLEAAAQGSLLIGACGFYEVYINGRRITKGAMAPYISNPDDMVYFADIPGILTRATSGAHRSLPSG